MKICDTHAVVKENVSAPNEIYRYHQTKFDFYITSIRPPPKSKKVFIVFTNELLWIIIK